ncbi:MAG: hypothetical protein RL266_1687 [Bacteroidota bacterium]
MKKLGFGHFEKQESWLYSASKDSKTIFRAADNVFAEVNNGTLFINIEGESVFGVRSTEKLLFEIKQAYEASADCTAEVEGPDYKAAMLGNLIYTAAPIITGSLLAIAIIRFGFEEEFPSNPTLVVYIMIGAVATKTRFWIHQRKKNRPAWTGSLILFSIPLAIMASLILLGGLLTLLNG